MPTGSVGGGTLPAELTSFVGRRRELAEVKRVLVESRLVTLTGVGGTGKTRLAVRLAAERRRAFPGGVSFVDLTSLRAPELLILEVQDPDVLAYLVMTALGLREQPGGGPPTEQLVQHFKDRRSLLVLDNCEHLLPVCAILADTLLRSCPHLRILATSREPLLLGGEVLFPVPPLPAPKAGERPSVAELARCDSTALFVARAQAVAPDFTLTDDNRDALAELCRRLDGLPLAIELAAARVRALTPAQILQRLGERFALLSRGNRNAPERQQTLRACAEWSFDLCSKPERLFWARLSVFAGGFELDAVEGVCAYEELAAEDLLEVVAGLVDKSILIRDQSEGASRYRMLETLRDYGREKLEYWGEYMEVRRRHRDWYGDLVRRAEADWISARQPDWFARMNQELPDVRAALEYCLTDPDAVDSALAIPARLYLYWIVHGLHSEGRYWLDQALAQPTKPTMALVKALYASAALAILQNDLEPARAHVRHAHEIAAQLGDPRAYAIAGSAEGVTEMGGDLRTAVNGWQRGADGLAGVEEGEYLFWRVNSLAGLAMTKAMLGDVEGATTGNESILAVCEPRGETWYAGMSMWILGLGLWKQGDSTAAADLLREALKRLRRVDDALGTGWCLDALAWIDFDDGWPERAATLFGAATRLSETMGARTAIFPELSAHHEQYEQRTRDALGEQAYRAAFARGESLSRDEAVAYALNESHHPTPPPKDDQTPLTRRERQVAELVAKGLSNKDIASTLVISQRTAEAHVENILAKLCLDKRTQVAAWMAAERPHNGGD